MEAFIFIIIFLEIYKYACIWQHLLMHYLHATSRVANYIVSSRRFHNEQNLWATPLMS